ncbi:MAG: gamma carbonic anhydrase family protein [Phycisphaerae bacterium]
MNIRFKRTAGGVLMAPSAVVSGEVAVGAGSSLWFGAVIRGDVAPVRIGRRVNVQDNCVIHCDSDVANEIGDDVTIGHGAIVHGKRLGDGCLIGMGAKVLGETVLGREVLVAAGCVVPPGLNVPNRSLVIGVPGRIARPVSEKELAYMAWLRGHYAELAGRYERGDFSCPEL